MKLRSVLFSLAFSASSAVASPVAARDSVTAVVNLNNNTGTPAHLVSGFIYGVPDTPNQIPDKFYTDMGFNYLRAGGAQVPAPGRGWIWGLQEYKVRRQHRGPSLGDIREPRPASRTCSQDSWVY